METCPTCHQPILPSMGNRQIQKIRGKNPNPVKPISTKEKPTDGLEPGPTLQVTLTHNGHSDTSTATIITTKKTPRGYRGQKKIGNLLTRINITQFPRRNTQTGTLTLINNGTPSKYPIPNHPIGEHVQWDPREGGDIATDITEIMISTKERV